MEPFSSKSRIVMQSKEQDPNNKDIPCQCNFIIVPRKEAPEESVDITGAECGGDCF